MKLDPEMMESLRSICFLDRTDPYHYSGFAFEGNFGPDFGWGLPGNLYSNEKNGRDPGSSLYTTMRGSGGTAIPVRIDRFGGDGTAITVVDGPWNCAVERFVVTWREPKKGGPIEPWSPSD